MVGKTKEDVKCRAQLNLGLDEGGGKGVWTYYCMEPRGHAGNHAGHDYAEANGKHTNVRIVWPRRKARVHN